AAARLLLQPALPPGDGHMPSGRAGAGSEAGPRRRLLRGPGLGDAGDICFDPSSLSLGNARFESIQKIDSNEIIAVLNRYNICLEHEQDCRLESIQQALCRT